MRAERGETAWLLPPDQLQRFAGSQRIYYALATYGGPRGEDARFSIAPHRLEQVPSLSLAPDFTGRTVDRRRIGQPPPSSSSYGGAAAPDLVWGGDIALEAEEQRERDERAAAAYDDGHSAALWDETSDGKPSDETSEGFGDGEPTENPDEVSANPPVAMAAGTGDCDDAIDNAADDARIGGDASDQRDDVEDDRHAAVAASVPIDDADLAEETPLQSLAARDEDADDEEDREYGGFEDAAALYGAVGLADEPAYDTVSPPSPDLVETSVGLGRDSGYRDEESSEEAPSQGLAVRALDIAEKVRLLRVVARAESGQDGYSAINPDNEYNDPSHPAYRKYHIGLSWGFIQFTQRSGALGKVLRAALRRSREAGDRLATSQRFESLFGRDWNALVDTTTAATADARVAPVGGAPLWDRVWTDRFRAAGKVDYITAAQNEVAVIDFVDPILPVARWLDLTTPRALALLVDRVVHMGQGGGLAFVLEAVGPLKTEHEWRRALEALGVPDLAAFQRSRAPRLRVDNRFGARAHAALIAALRELGSKSPLPIPDRDSMLRSLLTASASRAFARRMRALADNTADFDDTTRYDLGTA